MPVEARLSNELNFVHLRELNGFVKTWRGKPKAQVIAESVSWINETNREVDSYGFGINNQGELVSKETGQSVVEIVGRQRTRYALGELEYQAILNIQNLVKKGCESPIVWISAPYKGIYPDTKLIVSQVVEEEGKRELYNTAVILDDFSYGDCLRLGKELFKLSNRPYLLRSVEELRSQPIPLDRITESWTQALNRLIKGKQFQGYVENINNYIDSGFKEKALEAAKAIYQEFFASGEKVNPVKVLRALNSMGVVGNFGSTCPVTIFDTIFARSNRVDIKPPGYWREGDCVTCHNAHNPNKKVGPCKVCEYCEDLDTRTGSLRKAA